MLQWILKCQNLDIYVYAIYYSIRHNLATKQFNVILLLPEDFLERL